MSNNIDSQFQQSFYIWIFKIHLININLPRFVMASVCSPVFAIASSVCNVMVTFPFWFVIWTPVTHLNYTNITKTNNKRLASYPPRMTDSCCYYYNQCALCKRFMWMLRYSLMKQPRSSFTKTSYTVQIICWLCKMATNTFLYDYLILVFMSALSILPIKF